MARSEQVSAGLGGYLIDLTLVTDGRRPAVSVIADVQEAVSATVNARFGITVATVAVHVCEISLSDSSD